MNWIPIYMMSGVVELCKLKNYGSEYNDRCLQISHRRFYSSKIQVEVVSHVVVRVLIRVGKLLVEDGDWGLN